jgi:sporulation protein YlmC with PRC-barrel domain
MKPTKARIPLPVLAALLALSLPAMARTPVVEANRVEMAERPPGVSLGRYVGQPVRGDGGETLGQVRDLIVDAHSGQLVYATVAGDGSEEARLVPFGALRAGGGNGFTIGIAPAGWSQVEPVRADDFSSRPMTLSVATQRALAANFRDHHAKAAGSGGLHLVPLANLRGKRVSTGVENVGEIKDVVIVPEQLQGWVVIAPEKDFQAGARVFVVPLPALNLTAPADDVLATRLTRAEFERARGAASR